jgi:hypothetical protein
VHNFKKMSLLKIVLLFQIGFIFLYSCISIENDKQTKEKYKQDLLSDDKIKIDKACYELGELKDTSSIRLLFTKILDPRISNDLRFKGMSVNYCRLIALRKISGIDIGRKIDQLGPDTAATYFYLDWAIKSGYLKSKSDIDIFYLKNKN